MKVQSTTADRLELQSRPWFLGIALTVVTLTLTFFMLVWLAAGEYRAAAKVGFGLIFAVVGFVAFVRREVAIFDRTANAVVLRSVSVFGTTETTRNLSDLASAEPRMNTSSSNSRRTTWRPELQLTDGTWLPLTQVYISGNSAQTCADAVKKWMGWR